MAKVETLGTITQTDAPADRPADLSMPLGLLGFEAEAEAEVPEGADDAGDIPFSLLIDGDIDVNGFWKQTSGGDWVNVASAEYGGQVTQVGNKTRLDFVIEDNGPFDSNSAPGAITDPGAPGYRVEVDPEPDPNPNPACPYDPFQPDQDSDGMPDAVEAPLGFNSTVKDNDVFGNNELFVRQLFRDLLGREGREEGIAYYTDALGGGALDRQGMIDEFVQSAEFVSHFGAIATIYHSVLGRSPVTCGMDYWLGEARQGVGLETIAGSVLASQEAQDKLGAGLSNAEFVTAVFANVFGDAASDLDPATWILQLDAGVSRAALIADWAVSAEVRQALEPEIMTDTLYLGLLDRDAKPEGQDYWEAQFPLFDDAAQFLATASAVDEYHDRFLPVAASAEQVAGQEMPELALIGQQDSADPGLAGLFA